MSKHRSRSVKPEGIGLISTKPAAATAVTRTPRWLQFGWQAAALAGMVLVAYWNSLDGSFHFDDWSLLNDAYLQAKNLGLGVFRLMQTRPLTYWTFHLNFLVGRAPLGFHLLNVLLHAANAVLVFWVAQRLLAAVHRPAPHIPRAAAEKTERRAPAMAFMAAAIFALHPLQTEAVSYIFQRASLLSTFFALLCFALFLTGRYGWSVLAFAASLAAKEEALALPAFLFLYDCLFAERAAAPKAAVSASAVNSTSPDDAQTPADFATRRPGWHPLGTALATSGITGRAWYYAALLALDLLAAGRLFYVLKHTKNAGVGFAVKDVTLLTYALTQARVIWHYLRLLVLPFGQNLDYDFALSRSLVQPWTTLPAVVLLLALAGWLVYRTWQRQVWAFAALGFLVLLAPSSSFVPQSDVIYEHRTYLPMIAMSIAAGCVLVTAFRRVQPREMRFVLPIVLVAVCLGLTIARNQVWASEVTLWTDVVEKSPNKARVYIGYSRGLMQQQKQQAAVEALQRGLALSPDDPELNMNLGATLLAGQQPQLAYPYFERAMKAGYSPVDCLSNMGAALFQMKEPDRSAEAFRQALAIDPCFYNARRNLMMALALSGHKPQALEAGVMPAGCRWLPGQEEDLRKYREQVENQ